MANPPPPLPQSDSSLTSQRETGRKRQRIDQVGEGDSQGKRGMAIGGTIEQFHSRVDEGSKQRGQNHPTAGKESLLFPLPPVYSPKKEPDLATKNEQKNQESIQRFTPNILAAGTSGFPWNNSAYNQTSSQLGHGPAAKKEAVRETLMRVKMEEQEAQKSIWQHPPIENPAGGASVITWHNPPYDSIKPAYGPAATANAAQNSLSYPYLPDHEGPGSSAAHYLHPFMQNIPDNELVGLGGGFMQVLHDPSTWLGYRTSDVPSTISDPFTPFHQ